MRAFILDRYGSADRVRAGEMPDPEPRADEVLVPPVVDRLVRHPQLRSDLRYGPAGLDQVEQLAAERDRVPPRHEDLLIISARDSSTPTARTAGQTNPMLSLARGLVEASSRFTGGEDRTRAGRLSPPSNSTWHQIYRPVRRQTVSVAEKAAPVIARDRRGTPGVTGVPLLVADEQDPTRCLTSARPVLRS